MLTVEQEATIVAFRRHTLPPLDDCLYALQATIPNLTRSSLHRCLQRHGISRLPDVEGEDHQAEVQELPACGSASKRDPLRNVNMSLETRYNWQDRWGLDQRRSGPHRYSVPRDISVTYALKFGGHASTLIHNRSYAGRYNGGRRVGPFTYINDVPKRTDERETVMGVSATYRLGYGQIETALSYRRLHTDARGFDFDFTALPTGGGQDFKLRNFWNAEMRFVSPAGVPFTYILGATHYRQDDRRFLASFTGTGTLDSFVAAPNQFAHARDWGAFASANWSPDVLPGLTLGAGVRYDHSHRASEQTAGSLNLGGGTVIAYRDAALSGSFDAVLPRLSLRYEPSSHLTFYANVAKGYIPGGFNLTAAQKGLSDDVLRYGSETMWSREVGYRWRSENNRIRLSGALFSIRANNWQEIQVSTDTQGRLISSDYIGADASIDSRGFELEAQMEPVRRLTLTANLGYADARYRDLQVDATTNLRGRRVKLIPAYDGYLAARYQTTGGLFLRTELALSGEQSLESRGDAVQGATQLVGVQLGYAGPRWSARAFVDNLTDVRRGTGMAFRNFGFGSDDNWYAPIGRSRQVGVEIGGRW